MSNCPATASLEGLTRKLSVKRIFRLKLLWAKPGGRTEPLCPVHLSLHPGTRLIEGWEHMGSRHIAVAKASLKMPAALELRFVRIGIEPGQDSSKLPVDEHKMAFRVIAIDQNRKGLKGHNGHRRPPFAGGVRPSDVTLEQNCTKSHKTDQR